MRNIKFGLLSVLLMFIGISNVYANTTICTYQNGNDYTVTCNIKDNKAVGCTIDANTNYEVKELNNKISYDDFNDGCASSINVMASIGDNIIEIEGILSDTYSSECEEGETHFCKEITKTKEGGSFGGSTNTDDSEDSGVIEEEDIIKNDWGTRETSTDDEEEQLDLDYFCQGKVQGVFTTIGWVIFIVKILVPILVIVFGSIDFAKAIVASKDDEIKKAATSLAKRVVIGIIIFIIPTILDFIVGIIGGDDVYNGTFKECTHCMLKPTDSACKNLRGN